jgi:hypothetical protein
MGNTVEWGSISHEALIYDLTKQSNLSPTVLTMYSRSAVEKKSIPLLPSPTCPQHCYQHQHQTPAVASSQPATWPSSYTSYKTLSHSSPERGYNQMHHGVGNPGVPLMKRGICMQHRITWRVSIATIIITCPPLRSAMDLRKVVAASRRTIPGKVYSTSRERCGKPESRGTALPARP